MTTGVSIVEVRCAARRISDHSRTATGFASSPRLTGPLVRLYSRRTTTAVNASAQRVKETVLKRSSLDILTRTRGTLAPACQSTHWGEREDPLSRAKLTTRNSRGPARRSCRFHQCKRQHTLRTRTARCRRHRTHREKKVPGTHSAVLLRYRWQAQGLVTPTTSTIPFQLQQRLEARAFSLSAPHE